MIDVYVHHVYDTPTVAGLKQGLLWVGSFSLPALPEPRLNYLGRDFAVTSFLQNVLVAKGHSHGVVQLGCC